MTHKQITEHVCSIKYTRPLFSSHIFQTIASYPDLQENDYFLFYELRSAADNLFDNGAGGYLTTPKPFDAAVEATMRKKIAAQLDTLIEHHLRHVVLSAFGCGAFGNPADNEQNFFVDIAEYLYYYIE